MTIKTEMEVKTFNEKSVVMNLKVLLEKIKAYTQSSIGETYNNSRVLSLQSSKDTVTASNFQSVQKKRKENLQIIENLQTEMSKCKDKIER